ncbi:MAG: nicotinate (nicotinamide) nucleotide adenylyltransferase [Treponema sp. CETP13]|nr:MAG: nicotinate (nicotinamide) nucleotide adenylyltransferase [Treponema sp. CETP13]
MKLAIIGGSFNPIHNGHLALADTVVKELGYDKVLFVPAFYPPHKELATIGVTNKDRLEMVKLAIMNNDAFQIETCEFDRQGVSYTIDTIDYLYKKYGTTSDKSVNDSSIYGKIGLVVGDDLVNGFSAWKKAKLLAKKTDIIIAQRIMKTDDFGSVNPLTQSISSCCNLNSETYPHVELKNAVLPISSAGIRASIHDDKAWRYLVSPSVYNYIKANNLYV